MRHIENAVGEQEYGVGAMLGLADDSAKPALEITRLRS
jgi:hypothetical protein